MKQQINSRAIDRRTLIKGTAAFGLSAAMTGCRPDDVSQAAEPPAAASKATEDHGHRLFFVEPLAFDEFYQHLIEMKPQPTMLTWGRAGRTQIQNAPPPQYVVWATADEAALLAAEASIKSLTKVQPDLVVEIGKPDQAAGKLAVKLFPNSARAEGEGRTYASVEDVVKSWQAQLSDQQGIAIKAVPKKDAEPTWGNVTESGQVIIEFDGPKLNDKVLKVIKSHPQTIGIKWGAPFTYYYCPGCGMG